MDAAEGVPAACAAPCPNHNLPEGTVKDTTTCSPDCPNHKPRRNQEAPSQTTEALPDSRRRTPYSRPASSGRRAGTRPLRGSEGRDFGFSPPAREPVYVPTSMAPSAPSIIAFSSVPSHTLLDHYPSSAFPSWPSALPVFGSQPRNDLPVVQNTAHRQASPQHELIMPLTRASPPIASPATHPLTGWTNTYTLNSLAQIQTGGTSQVPAPNAAPAGNGQAANRQASTPPSDLPSLTTASSAPPASTPDTPPTGSPTTSSGEPAPPVQIVDEVSML